MNTPAETERAAMERQLREIKDAIADLGPNDQFAVTHLAATIRTIVASSPMGPMAMGLVGAELAVSACES